MSNMYALAACKISSSEGPSNNLPNWLFSHVRTMQFPSICSGDLLLLTTHCINWRVLHFPKSMLSSFEGPSDNLPNWLFSHVRRMPFASICSGDLPSKHSISTLQSYNPTDERMTTLPSTRNLNIMHVSCSTIIILPIGKWNVFVSGLQHSTTTVSNVLSWITSELSTVP